MDLYVIRHAIAHDRDLDRWPTDDERPLSDEGVGRFTQASKGLAKITSHPDLVLASPLVRTVQTAQILSSTIGWPEAETSSVLEPGASPSEIIGLLAATPGAESIAVVGHEPDLGALVSVLCAGSGVPSFIPMKKGGVARVSCSDAPAPGNGTLRSLLTQRALQGLR